MMMRALRSSSRSRAFSRSSFRTFLASRLPPEGLGPRFFASPRNDPSRAAFRHADRCELYKPSLHLGDAVITLIAGCSEWTGPKYGATESNLVSIVLRLDYEGRSVLFTGDTGGRTGERDDEPPECMLAEELLVENSENVSIDSDVIIAPHHGANDGSSECFIEKVTPEYVIFPAGDRYGHPRKQTAARYLRSEPPPRAILRTDRGNDERNSDHWEQATCDDQKRDDDIDIILSKDTVFATYRSDHGACPTRVPPARPQPDTPTVP